MGLINEYIKKEGRILPVFLLIDTSGSMSGQKIETVNIALKEMLNSFKKIENPKGVIEVGILTFGGEDVNVIKPLSKIKDDDHFNLTACGCTPMGKAFDYVADYIEDEQKLPRNVYTPTIVLISDGMPTDYRCTDNNIEFIQEWPSLKRILSGKRCSKAIKVAMGIGDDANKDILKAFINNSSIPVISAKDNETITKFFNWVTMSISVRSVSANPNQATVEDTFMFDDDEIVF